MVADEGQRKLAAILAADVAGYSRLMADDDRATVRTLTAYREIFAEHIAAHDGRVVDTAGDSVLAIFESVIEAVEAAIEIQRVLAERNQPLPENRRMQFRIGVNLGDIIVRDDGTIYGDGVNVAARLEGLAAAGGVTVSESAHMQVRRHAAIVLADAGEHEVKNISDPVRAFHVVLDGAAPAVHRGKQRFVAIAAACAVLGIAGFAWWYGAEPVPDEPVSELAEFLPPAPLATSLAVLPFSVLGGDPDQAYFSDGLTTDLITALARVSHLRVLAQHRTAGLDIESLDTAEAGGDLGVRFVVGGSVRKDDDHLRVNVQLIDLEDGSQLWAERYDRDYVDVFAVQDDIVSRIVGAITSSYFGALEVRLADASATKDPTSLDAYELLLSARHIFWNDFSRDGYRNAVGTLNQALELDSEYARAHRELAWFTLIGWIFRFDDSISLPAPVIENAIQSARLDPNDPEARRVGAYGLFFDKQLDRFRQEAKAALNMAPFDADIMASIAMAYGFMGDWEGGVALAKKANVLDEYAASGWYHTTLYYDYYLKGEYDAAIEIIAGHPNQNLAETVVKYVMAYGAMGDAERAMEYWRTCLEIEPDFSPQKLIDLFRTWNFREQDIDSLMEGIYAAGIPRPDAALTN